MPGDVPPALVGQLTGQTLGAMGVLFDLARRGWLQIREEAGFLGSKKYILEFVGQEGELSAHEQGLLSAIFKPGESAVKLSDVPTRLASKSKLFSEPLEAEMVARGWLDPERKAERNKLLAIDPIE